MKKAFIELTLAVLLSGCHRNQGDPQPDPTTQVIQELADRAKLLDDNQRLDQPTFDDSNADRLFPYSPVVLTRQPRLIQTKENGTVIYNYRYDSVGRLQEVYHNFNNSDEASSRQIFQYGEQGLEEIDFYYGSYPGVQLWNTRKLTFFTNRAGRIDRYFDGADGYGSGTTRLLRFDPNGQLIWSAAVVGDPNSSTEVSGYTRAIRDATNNVRTLRSPVGKFYTIDYEYDNKPNPFYLLNAPDFTSPNNMIKETRRNLSGDVVSVVEYTYEYRADGYPIRRRSGTDVIEYVYAN